MQEMEEEKRETPLVEAEDVSEAISLAEADKVDATANKALPASIIPPNKASTAPSQEVIERFAPGSAPHWVGASAFLAKDTGSDKAGGGAVYVKG